MEPHTMVPRVTWTAELELDTMGVSPMDAILAEMWAQKLHYLSHHREPYACHACGLMVGRTGGPPAVCQRCHSPVMLRPDYRRGEWVPVNQRR